MKNEKVILLIFGILLFSLTYVSASNIILDPSFEWNNNTWTPIQTTGCVANQSTTAQHYSGLASGETNTTQGTMTPGSASLTQTINQLVTNFNFTNSLFWWVLWQANATSGARDCYAVNKTYDMKRTYPRTLNMFRSIYIKGTKTSFDL